MKVLLLDASFSALPIYRFLVRTEHEIFVMGNRSSDLLAQEAGAQWIEQDYSRVEEVQQHVDRLGIDCIVPGCTDVSMETCVQLKAKVKFCDSIRSNFILNNKVAFRNLCEEFSLPAPRIVEKGCFPKKGRFICKPADAFSGRGMTVFEGSDLSALESAWDVATRASRSNTAVIETFADGELYSCSAFIEGGKSAVAFFVREGSSANPFAVDTSYVVYDLPAECTATLEKCIERLATVLSLGDGLIHIQFILSGMTPLIIEVTRRLPGDLYAFLIEYSTGLGYAEKYASYFLGGSSETTQTEKRYILRHTVSAADEMVLERVEMRRPLPLHAFFPLQVVGQKLFEKQGTRVGIMFFEVNSHIELLGAFDDFKARRAYSLGVPQ